MKCETTGDVQPLIEKLIEVGKTSGLQPPAFAAVLIATANQLQEDYGFTIKRIEAETIRAGEDVQ